MNTLDPSLPRSSASSSPRQSRPGATFNVTRDATPHIVISLRTKAHLLIMFALLILGWHRTLIDMWMRWFPAWHKHALTFSDRFTQGESYYTHGPLVPLVSLILAIFIHRCVGLPSVRTRTASLIGVAIFVFSLAMHLLSASPGARVMFVSGFALIGVITGLLLIYGGWPLLRAYGVPVALLVFMVPLPQVAIVDLNFQLKFLAGRAAIWVTHHVFAVPAVMDGSYIYLPPDDLGYPKTLVIENVCSGLRSLISLVWFASLFAVICRVCGVWRWLMLAMAVPVAMACNVARITVLNLVAHHFSVEAAAPRGWVHQLTGLLVFALALATLFAIEQAIILFANTFKRPWVDPRLLGFLAGLRRFPLAKPGDWPRYPLVALALAAAACVYWSAYTPSRVIGGILTLTVPATVTIDNTTFTGHDHELDARTLAVLENPLYLQQRFTDPDSARFVDLLVVFSQDNRKATHPPEVCIEGSGHNITAKNQYLIPVPGLGDLPVRELITQQGGKSNCFLYTYKCEDRYTASFFSQQASVFINGLLGRDASAAMIRFYVQAGPQGIETSRQFVRQAAQALLPQIHRSLNQPGSIASITTTPVALDR